MAKRYKIPENYSPNRKAVALKDSEREASRVISQITNNKRNQRIQYRPQKEQVSGT